MPYDTGTADRRRECLATTPGVTQQALSGGPAFPVGGRTAVAEARRQHGDAR